MDGTNHYVQVQGGGFAVVKNDGLVHSVGQRGGTIINKDNCVQLVLEGGGDRQMNILEYLKTEILDEKRLESRIPINNSSPDKENGTVVSFFERDIALKIEVMEDGVARNVTEQQHPIKKPLTIPHQQIIPSNKICLTSPIKRRKKKFRDKLLRPKNYVCGECGTGFVSTKDLNRHRVVHTGEKPYSCPYCDQKFTAPSSRATHIRSIHEKSQEFLCPECEKPFNQKSNMVKHYKTIHLETVVIICQECGRDFNQASALRRHIKIVHKKELPHACGQCGKRFALAESLKKHMEAIHLKSRAYPCTYCDYAASRADMLKIHIRKIHTKEWSYKCGVCEAKGTPWGCILPKELRRHMQTRHPQEHQMQQEVEDKNKEDEKLRLEKRAKAERRAKQQTLKLERVEKMLVNVEDRAQQLLNEIKQPLEFSVQLEAEVRAKACRAPPSVLATSQGEKEEVYTMSQQVVLGDKRQNTVKPVLYTEQVAHILPSNTVATQPTWGTVGYSAGVGTGTQFYRQSSVPPPPRVGTEYTQQAQGDRWVGVAQAQDNTGTHTVVVQQNRQADTMVTHNNGNPSISALRLLYDFPRT